MLKAQKIRLGYFSYYSLICKSSSERHVVFTVTTLNHVGVKANKPQPGRGQRLHWKQPSSMDSPYSVLQNFYLGCRDGENIVLRLTTSPWILDTLCGRHKRTEWPIIEEGQNPITKHFNQDPYQVVPTINTTSQYFLFTLEAGWKEQSGLGGFPSYRSLHLSFLTHPIKFPFKSLHLM